MISGGSRGDAEHNVTVDNSAAVSKGTANRGRREPSLIFRSAHVSRDMSEVSVPSATCRCVYDLLLNTIFGWVKVVTELANRLFMSGKIMQLTMLVLVMYSK